MLISVALLSALPLSATGQQKTVLAIYSDERLTPANIGIDVALRDSLGVDTDNPPTYLSEFLDFSRFSTPGYDKLESDFLHNKYAGQSIDVVVAVGALAFQFLYRHQTDLFPRIPVVLVGLTRESLPQTLPPNFVAVPVVVEPLPTFELALRLQPDAREIVVVTGTSEADRFWEARLRRELPNLQTSVPIRYLSGLTLEDLLQELSRLRPNTIVYVTAFNRDGAGRTYIPLKILRQMKDASAAPIYASYSSAVGLGIVGGSVLRVEEAIRQAAGVVSRIFRGEKLTQADMPQAIPAQYVVDWRQLRRWHLSEARLPPGTIVLNRELGPWQRYKLYIIGGLSLFLLETLLILGLLWQRATRRKVEKNLAVSNDRFRLAVEAGKSVGWEWDVKSGRNRWFGDLQTMFGIPSDIYEGDVEEFRRRVHPEDNELVWKAVTDARDARKPYATEFRVVKPDGTVRWVTARGKFHYGRDGDPESMLGMAADITERKQIEQELHESQDRLTSVVASAMDAIIAVNDEQLVVLFNKSAEKMFGCPAGNAIGSSIERFIPQRFRAEHSMHIRRFGETGVTTRAMGKQGALRALRSDGEEFPIEASISHVEVGGKNLFTVIVRDITERRRADEALRESEERFRLVANTAPVLIWMSGPDKLCTYFNEPWLEFTGRRLEDELGDGWAKGVHPDDLEKCLETYNLAFDLRQPFQMEYRLQGRDGQFRWVLDNGVPRVNADGSFVGYIGSCVDLTERKQTELALSQSEQLKAAILESLRNCVAVLDPKGTIIAATSRDAEFVEGRGINSLQLRVGTNYFEICRTAMEASDRYVAAAMAGVQAIYDGKQSYFELEYDDKSGVGQRWFLMSVTRLKTAGGGIVISHQEITERKRHEQAIRELSGRLINAQEQERSRIARELHDDINQQVALLAIELQQLQNFVPPDSSEGRQKVESLWKKTYSLSTDLQQLSHQLHSTRLEHLGIVVALQGLCEEFAKQHNIKADFQFRHVPEGLDHDTSLSLFRVAQESLHNVAKHSRAKEVRMELIGTSGAITLRVSDDGVGFDRDAPQTQTGLGMISMTERIRFAGGVLLVSSRPSGGTQVEAAIPLVRNPGTKMTYASSSLSA